MKLPSVKNVQLKGKKVLLRVDFNVPIKRGKITDDFRIKRTLPTINLLKKEGAKIILMSHLTSGRAKSLRPVAKFLSASWQIDFISEVLGPKVEGRISRMKNGDILLLGNLRSNDGEEKNSPVFAREMAKLGDIYVNDAFSVSHRKHASIVSLPKYLHSYTGLLFAEELKNLRSAFNPKRPFLLILGGVKFGSKLGVLKKFIKTADKIFIGGALANNFFKAQGLNIGKSVFDGGISVRKYFKSPKIILPIDVKTKNTSILDCGPNTVKLISGIISKSKFILWNGPLGDFEKAGFEKGTWKVAKLIAGSRAKTIIGGGDTIAAVREINNGKLLEKFSFVSTGGGAMLEFLAKGTLPGIEVLIRKPSDNGNK